MIRFDKKWFNPLYFILNQIIKNDSVRTILVYGGKSSSKTISVTQVLAKECYVKGSNAIAFRKESAIIPTTLKKSFQLAISSTRLSPAFETQDRKFLCENQGGEVSEIVLKGLDHYEKAKGVESYKFIYLDELNHFAKEEYEQFDLSMRGIKGQKILASWNPVDESTWVKTSLIDNQDKTGQPQNKWIDTDKYGSLPCENSFIRVSEDGKTILIKTTFEDNYWIVGSPCGTYGYRDENLIAVYEALKSRNYNSYKVNVLGEWGKTVFGGEFLKAWRSETHTGVYPYNPKLAVYLIFDENVNPYFPCGIFQVAENGKEFFLVHIIAKENPENTVNHMCREIDRKLNAWGHKEAVFVGGDATSKKEDVKLEKGQDIFRMIINGIDAKHKARRAVATSNPSVRTSADFFNDILEFESQGLSLRVDKSCKTAITDYENTKEDKNGKVDKTTVTNPVTGVSYQPFGHFVDLTRYFICYVFAKEYAEYQRGDTAFQISMGKASRKNTY